MFNVLAETPSLTLVVAIYDIAGKRENSFRLILMEIYKIYMFNIYKSENWLLKLHNYNNNNMLIDEMDLFQ